MKTEYEQYKQKLTKDHVELGLVVDPVLACEVSRELTLKEVKYKSESLSRIGFDDWLEKELKP